MSHAFKSLIFLSLLGAAVAASAQQRVSDADRLLDDVFRVNHTLRFRGVRVVTFRSKRDGKPQERKVTEFIVRDGNRSRTEYSGDENIAGQIAVDDGVNRFQYLPKENVINRMPSVHHESEGRFESMLKSRRQDFNVQVKEGGKVADLPTHLIEMVGKDGQTHKIWVEKRGKAILRREFFGSNSDRGMSYEFQTFQYQTKVNPADFVIEKSGAKVLGPEDRLFDFARKFGVEPYRMKGQSGFQLFDARGSQVEQKVVLRSTYGNGRIIVTLVQVRGELDQSRLDRLDDRRFKTFVWADGPYNFVLIGDLPPAELQRLSRLVGR